jgi:hypothetical protein
MRDNTSSKSKQDMDNTWKKTSRCLPEISVELVLEQITDNVREYAAKYRMGSHAMAVSIGGRPSS